MNTRISLKLPWLNDSFSLPPENCPICGAEVITPNSSMIGFYDKKIFYSYRCGGEYKRIKDVWTPRDSYPCSNPPVDKIIQYFYDQLSQEQKNSPIIVLKDKLKDKYDGPFEISMMILVDILCHNLKANNTKETNLKKIYIDGQSSGQYSNIDL